MDDPDIYEMEDYSEIGIFVPGEDIEREVNGSEMLKHLFYTLVAFGVTILLTLVLVIPMSALGLITVDLYAGTIYYEPWALILLTIAEVGFIVPPFWYAKSRGYSLRSIGLRYHEPLKEIVLGFGFGAAMLGANLVITYFIAYLFQLPMGDAGEGFFLATDWIEVAAWVVVMFVFVGFSEELLFRGYLQRRMEVYFRPKQKQYKWIALIVTSLIFAAFHLDIIGLPTRFVLGMFLGYLCEKRKYSILGPSVAHGFNNAAVVVLAFLGF